MINSIKTTLMTNIYGGDRIYNLLAMSRSGEEFLDEVNQVYSFCMQRPSPTERYEYTATLMLTACAHMSLIDQDRFEQDCLGLLVQGGALKLADNSVSEPDPLKAILAAYEWPFPFSPIWVWDAIYQFKGVQQVIGKPAKSTVMLIDVDGHGVIGRLILELIPGFSDDIEIFPDPRFMSTTQINTGYESIREGAIFALSLFKDRIKRPVGIRWRIMIPDEKVAPKVWDVDSLGAAFSLCVVNLLTESGQFLSGVDLPEESNCPQTITMG
jgi:hypothetical protein